MARSDDRFLQRWSRRKQEGDAGKPDAEPGLSPADEVAALPVDAEEPVPEDLDLPDIDSLDKDSDYTAFLKEGVPEVLQRRALRKLWLSDPAIGYLDGLNDYDEDVGLLFKTFEGVVKTIFKVDEGMAADEGQEAEQASDKQTAEPERERDDAPSDAGQGEASLAESQVPEDDADADADTEI